MFEDKSYPALLKSALGRLPNSLDKREGSMLWDGVAPAMAELALLYLGLDFVLQAGYISTAPREYLLKRAQERGLFGRSSIKRYRWAAVFPVRI